MDLEGAPTNVSAIPMRQWRGRPGSYMGGIRLAYKLWQQTNMHAPHRAAVLFTGGTISIGWRPVALCFAMLGVPVLVENVLLNADDGAALLQARWSSLTRLAASRLKAF